MLNCSGILFCIGNLLNSRQPKSFDVVKEEGELDGGGRGEERYHRLGKIENYRAITVIVSTALSEIVKRCKRELLSEPT